MHRRRFLAIAAATVATSAGCVSRGRSGGSSNDRPCTMETPSNSQVPVSTNTESFVETYPPDKPVMEFVIGDEQSQATEIPDTRIENETEENRTFTATVRKGADSPTEVLRTECELAPGEYVSLAPITADTYTIQVEADSIDRQSSLTIEPWMFEEGRSVTCHVNIQTDTIEATCGGGGGGGGG